jgi:subtilase family serine protease
MRVDPENLLYEENERNNRSTRIVRLPYRDGPQHC